MPIKEKSFPINNIIAALCIFNKDVCQVNLR